VSTYAVSQLFAFSPYSIFSIPQFIIKARSVHDGMSLTSEAHLALEEATLDRERKRNIR